MASNAITAQGSKVYIGSGTASAVTITGITNAYEAEVTGTHALSKGDVVTFASIAAGTLATLLNGNSYVVIDVTGTTKFVVKADTRAVSTWSSGGTATPVTWTQIKEVKSFSGFDGKATELDTTNLDSTAKEFKLGLQDFGSFKMDTNVVHGDPGQLACVAAKAAATIKQFKLLLADSSVGTFYALVTDMPEQGSANSLYSGSIGLKITGSVTWA